MFHSSTGTIMSPTREPCPRAFTMTVRMDFTEKT